MSIGVMKDSKTKAEEATRLQKGPPIGRETVFEENSDFLGEKTNRKSEKT